MYQALLRETYKSGITYQLLIYYWLESASFVRVGVH